MEYLQFKRNKSFETLTDHFSYAAWEELCQSTLLIIMIFNRRRAGEMERVNVADYEAREAINNEKHVDILKNLSKEAKKICEKYMLLQLRGKLCRQVSVLLDEDMALSIKMIIDSREQARVDPQNPYIFALSGPITYKSEHLRACELMRRFSTECGASVPHSLRGTELRKHLATNFVTFNLNNVKRATVADHLGHDIQIHKNFYQVQNVAKEIVEMSQVLEVACGGKRTNINNNPGTSTAERMNDTDESEDETDNADVNRTVPEITSYVPENESPQAAEKEKEQTGHDESDDSSNSDSGEKISGKIFFSLLS